MNTLHYVGFALVLIVGVWYAIDTQIRRDRGEK